MPTITIDMFAGRTREQQRQLVAGVTDAAVKALGVDRELVKVRLNELQPHLVAMGGNFKAEPGDPGHS